MLHIKNNISWLENFINHPEEYKLQIIVNPENVDDFLKPYVKEFINSQGEVDHLNLILHEKEEYVCFLVSEKSFSLMTDYCSDHELDFFIQNKENVSKSIISVMNQLEQRITELENKYLGGNE